MKVSHSRIDPERAAWLSQMRHETEERYDWRWAPLYGERYGDYPNQTHQQFFKVFLERLPPHSQVLDAACGAGRYIPLLQDAGHHVTGIDQSAGMLARAREFFPEVQLEKVGLQELAFQGIFDGAICMDAMENVSPEDWPLVLDNFHAALKPGGWLYFTVELCDAAEAAAAYQRAQAAGLPVVYGEWPDEVVYHYYPSIPQVKEWLGQAGLEVVEEGEGDGYYHLICQHPGDLPNGG